jgi:hypothetical protein
MIFLFNQNFLIIQIFVIIILKMNINQKIIYFFLISIYNSHLIYQMKMTLPHTLLSQIQLPYQIYLHPKIK